MASPFAPPAESAGPPQLRGAGDLSHLLVTFDVDGTLVRARGTDANRFHKNAFTHAFREVFGLEALSIDTVKHHGLTDALVAAQTLVAAGVPAADAERRWPEVQAAMLAFAAEHKSTAADGLELLPGVVQLLSTLQTRGATVGLVTGNLEPIGWSKMEELRIAQLFTAPRFGGFGTDHSDRGELVRIAGERALALSPGISTRWHVGDTPADVQAAAFGGAKALGVCTGVFSAEELRAANGAAVVVPDLADVDAVLALLAI